MAGSTPRRRGPSGAWVLSLLLLAPVAAAATQFLVGGSAGWRVPAAADEPFNHWAERIRFQIGDSLLFAYPAGNDSVLQVSMDDYGGCNTANPVQKFTGGSTVVPLDRSGPFFFIGGNPDGCGKNEKLVVVVMADRSNRTAGATSPPPSPAPQTPPSPAPQTPPPASPTPEASPAGPPPPAAVEIVPSPPPPPPPPPPSGAPPKAVGSAGVLLGSVLLMVL